VLVRDFGELAAVLAPFAFFAALVLPHGQWRDTKRWIVPCLLGVGFTAANIADIVFNQGFTGVFAFWSVGLRLWLPWPLYALSLALYAYCVLTCFAKGEKAELANLNTGLGLLLLLFAGHELQLSYQHLLAALSLLLLTGIARPYTIEQPDPQTEPARTPKLATEDAR
jgi:hypothetical protein